MGRVVILENSGEISGANKRKVILDRKYFSFLVYVIDRFPPQPVAMRRTEFWIVFEVGMIRR